MASNLDQIRDQQRETWDRFSTGWQHWDGLVTGWMAPFGDAIIRRAKLREDSEVLDVATGTGEPGLTAATLVPQGRVTLTDLSERMLAVAADHAARRGLSNVATRVGEAGQLPFADRSFDAVLCRFGFMFFPDIPAAAQELVRVTRPGGRISVAVWSTPDQNPWATTVTGTIARHVAVPASPPDAPGLFRCATPGSLREVFARAGLSDLTEEDVSCDLVHDSPEAYWQFMTDVAAPVVSGLARADEPTRDAIRDEVLGLARDHLRHGQVHLRSTATVVCGTRG